MKNIQVEIKNSETNKIMYEWEQEIFAPAREIVYVNTPSKEE